MEGLGPWAVIRGATFDCGLAVVAEVAALPVADVLLAALLLLGDELHPAKPMAIATIAIPVLASVRFIALAPVGWALRRAFANQRVGELTVNGARSSLGPYQRRSS